MTRTVPKPVKTWRDRIDPKKVDWEVLTDWRMEAARDAAYGVMEYHNSTMLNVEDVYQDALLYMASHAKDTVSFRAKSMLTKHLVTRLWRSYRADDELAKVIVHYGTEAESICE